MKGNENIDEIYQKIFILKLKWKPSDGLQKDFNFLICSHIYLYIFIVNNILHWCYNCHFKIQCFHSNTWDENAFPFFLPLFFFLFCFHSNQTSRLSHDCESLMGSHYEQWLANLHTENDCLNMLCWSVTNKWSQKVHIVCGPHSYHYTCPTLILCT